VDIGRASEEGPQGRRARRLARGRVARLLVVAATASRAHAQAPPPTFHETVEPLLQKHCVQCHREGGSGPFSLEDFADVVGWAPQIREVVTTRRMPPWGADPTIGKFSNDRSLPAATIETLVRWIDGGRPEGDAAHAPPKRTWPKEWSLAEPPDLVLTTPTFHVPAEGTLLYEYPRLPTGLTTSRYVRAAEVRTTNPQVLHHVLIFRGDAARAPAIADAVEPPWRPVFDPFQLLQGAKSNERPLYVERFQKLIARDFRYGDFGGMNGYFLSGLSGGGAVTFAPDEGKFLSAGSTLVAQIHYQPNGKAADSTTSIALWFAPPDAKIAKPLDTRGVSTAAFKIPPGDPNFEVRAHWRLPAAATLRSLQPHMHVRGKDFTYFAKLPPAKDGTPGIEEKLLFVPHYDFNWQHEYILAEPRRLPAGTVLEVVAHFDNSKANPANPDPTQTVWFGLQTYEEMMIGYFEAVWDPDELDEGE
jgi:mono/diheme cytochrome c family protein